MSLNSAITILPNTRRATVMARPSYLLIRIPRLLAGEPPRRAETRQRLPSVTPRGAGTGGGLGVFAGSCRSGRGIGDEANARRVRGLRGDDGAEHRPRRADAIDAEARRRGDITSIGGFGRPGQPEASEMQDLLVLLELDAARRRRHRHGEIERTQEDQYGKEAATAHDENLNLERTSVANGESRAGDDVVGLPVIPTRGRHGPFPPSCSLRESGADQDRCDLPLRDDRGGHCSRRWIRAASSVPSTPRLRPTAWRARRRRRSGRSRSPGG